MSEAAMEKESQNTFDRIREGLEGLEETADYASKLWENLMREWGRIDMTPKAELLHRLNLRVQDIDPGEPVHWKGERGLRG